MNYLLTIICIMTVCFLFMVLWVSMWMFIDFIDNQWSNNE